nr:hypothetical protein Iba_chr11eCG13810 [Ipomoea batatas]
MLPSTRSDNIAVAADKKAAEIMRRKRCPKELAALPDQAGEPTMSTPRWRSRQEKMNPVILDAVVSVLLLLQTSILPQFQLEAPCLGVGEEQKASRAEVLRCSEVFGVELWSYGGYYRAHEDNFPALVLAMSHSSVLRFITAQGA